MIRISAAENTLVYQMPLGNYTDFQVEPSCGLAVGMNGVIDTFDDPRSFYSTDRQQAQLIWFSRGYIEYRFPNKINPLEHPGDELFHGTCSEAPGYNAQWPSDITFSVNGTEIGTYTCPGDLGARRGKTDTKCMAHRSDAVWIYDRSFSAKRWMLHQ